jgi:hypothetical protein
MIYLVFSEIPLEHQLRSAENEKWASPLHQPELAAKQPKERLRNPPQGLSYMHMLKTPGTPGQG